jgi:hypothetical protein
MERGLPMDPPAPLSERIHALRYFINNLAPGVREFWIHYSDRVRVAEFMHDDLPRLGPDDPVPSASSDSPTPRAVVLNSDGVLLGTVEQPNASPRALDAVNPNPQTIRPDMTPRLATHLLKSNPYLIVTTAKGKYHGRYVPEK